MDYDGLLNEVMQRAQLASSADAMRVIKAVTETLGKRLGDIEQKDLRAQLPRQMKGWIHQRPNGEAFPVSEFYRRVAERADLLESEAEANTRIVLSSLGRMVSEGQMQDLFEVLPPEYREVFEGEVAEPHPRPHLTPSPSPTRLIITHKL